MKEDFLNEDAFRANPLRRDALRDVLALPIVSEATMIARLSQLPKRSNVSTVAPTERTALYSQSYTFQAGWHAALEFLETLTKPLPEKAAASLPDHHWVTEPKKQ